VLAVAVGLVLVGAVHVAATNLQGILGVWGEGTQLTIYFQPDVAPGRAASVAEGLRRVPGITHVRYLTSADAMRRLRQGLGGHAALLDGVEDDFLPPSLEVSFARGAGDAATLKALVARIERMPGVDEVETMGDWVARLQAASDFLRLASLTALLFVGGACLYLVGATIKLAVFARRDEIEILKLVGATDRYVRAPFWIEGALEGLAGGLIGVTGLWILFRAAVPRVQSLLGGLTSSVQLDFPPFGQLVAAVGASALLGLLGAHLAVRRHLHV
jgi:cell division transport system permease protein